MTVPLVAAPWYAIVAAAERRYPYREDWNLPSDSDVAVDSTFMAAGLATTLVAQQIGDALARKTRLDLGLRRLPTVAGVALAVAAYDLAHTLHHRVAHEWGPAWTVHSVHHSALRLHWLNATRFHVAELLFDGTLDALIVGILGMSREQHVGFLSVRALYGQVQHCNVDVRSGLLNRIFSTPDLHRWHHSTLYEEGDSNFGAITSVWDQALGSFMQPAEPFDGTVGVGRMPEFPTGFNDLLKVPIEWDQIKEANATTYHVLQ